MAIYLADLQITLSIAEHIVGNLTGLTSLVLRTILLYSANCKIDAEAVTIMSSRLTIFRKSTDL